MNGDVTLLYGPDRMPVQSKTEELFAAAGVDPADVESFDMEETTVDEAVAAAMTIPFLSERKGVVLRNAYFLAAAPKPQKEPEHRLERLQEYLSHPNPTTVLVVQVVAEKLDSRKALARVFAEKAAVVECLPARKEDAYAVVRRRVEETGHTIDADALEEFAIRTKESEGIARNELDKLILFAGKKVAIDVKMVRSAVTKNVEDNVFDLVNAYLAKDAWSVTSTLQDLFKSGIDPASVATLMASKFQEILYAKELLRTGARFDDVMKYFGASRGRTYYIMKNANEQDDAFVLDRLSRLEELDFGMKSGTIDKRVGLETFLYRYE